MDIFVQRLPPQATTTEVKKFFDETLKNYGVETFSVEKWLGRNNGKLSILEVASAQLFLNDFGVPQGAPSYIRPRQRLLWNGSELRLWRDRFEPSEHSVRALEYQARQGASNSRTRAQASNTAGSPRFDTNELMCGMWIYRGSQLAYMPFFTDGRSGSMTFGTHQAVLLIRGFQSDEYRVYFEYHSIEDIVLGPYQQPTITLKLRVAPKLYRVGGNDDLVAALSALNLGSGNKDEKKLRLTSLNAAHAKVVGTCFVYQVTLRDRLRISEVRTLLNQNVRMPTTTALSTPVVYPDEPFDRSMLRLDFDLTDQSRYGYLPFTLLFQTSALAKNGILHPLNVRRLLPSIANIHQSRGLDTALATLRRFATQVPSATPETEAGSVSMEALEDMLIDFADAYDRYGYSPEDPYQLSERFQHINLVHKIAVTPTGVYLRGPYPEPTNRVLRRYSDHIDHFVRMVFEDEDGSSVRYDPRSDQREVYSRFKQVLDGSVIIAGRAFSFLGFSHSSLRAQSVWCMAPIFLRGTLQLPEHILRELGDFSQIQVPAKCAARIGQNFTDTNATIELCAANIGTLPMVQRNGRDFSDGVGTISQEMLEGVWRVYGTRRLLKPTALQIRFQGYKGMVSLDSRLQGKHLMLRENMKKFEASSAWYLEICGAGFRPLPMILNRQLIKILEDLGIQRDVFMDLQAKAVDALRVMTGSAINTAHMLEQAEITRATRTPYLIQKLGQIGLDYHQDPFLYHVVEMTVIAKLRDIKYRGRIPVKDGVTLYGVMDETGYLREGEIYVTTESAPQGGRWELIRKNVIVTRSPVMHPGDVQIVNAVAVPSDSPLKKLHNVVVFSQHGVRDLPSMLSGGDLDGDLYNVIWDPNLVPARTCPPADYPRVSAVQLGRPVTRRDMSDFFVTFMQTDQLGMLSNIHLQLADQRPFGTHDAACTKLAHMASVSVDFSKTGIPVDMKECPKYERIRPDFMAPGPRVLIEGEGEIQFEEANAADEALNDLEYETPPMRFYRSDKVLGHLYRAIDEQQFLSAMQQQHRTLLITATPGPSLPEKLLAYMLREATSFGVMFSHHAELAAEIRDGYEDSLLDILHQHGPSAHQAATEYEAFAGCILGRQGGAQGKPLRELSKKMREQFESVCEYTSMRIIKGDEQMQGVTDLDLLYDDQGLDREVEALPRAIACLKVAVEGEGRVDRGLGELKSFKYVAAAVCLRELERFRVTTMGSSFLPRV